MRRFVAAIAISLIASPSVAETAENEDEYVYTEQDRLKDAAIKSAFGRMFSERLLQEGGIATNFECSESNCIGEAAGLQFRVNPKGIEVALSYAADPADLDAACIAAMRMWRNDLNPEMGRRLLEEAVAKKNSSGYREARVAIPGMSLWIEELDDPRLVRCRTFPQAD
ncbi:hypothetical protein [Notoacmeibacter ruber]|uniref:Uncharacterized protein n=1 Tax=Notoacmeibacter ruber TaxID=2670375 RepID=A0A3L7JEM4_9HYPH|nr:hypothetical protein [Notoacmeibacter ruber]RLQ88930.1 hypothetical protein D8780_12515 [Notoacmeibacter ruber]